MLATGDAGDEALAHTWPRERTTVQEGNPVDPRYDLRTDAVMVYGAHRDVPERVSGWKARGYVVHYMTGLAWGEYQDYILGRWDGKEHWQEAQYLSTEQPKLHGPFMPYMAPTPAYAEYLKSLLKQAIDAGVEAIFLEEPEFWSYTGYGPAFREAYLAQHHIPWSDPATDTDVFVLAAEVKYRLYCTLLDDLSRFVKQYGKEQVRCYVATHSPLNYAAWGIVSPELGTRAMTGCDGAIVQVWSFTARSQTYFEARKSERVLEVAYLEYGSGLELVRGTSRHLWFLADPVEDSPAHGWDRYRSGYEATLVASLFHPEVGAYEVMPWPSRVFTGRYPGRPQGPPGEVIPPQYASELLAIAHALRSMPQGPGVWDCGVKGVGVLISDTMMFRRGGPENEDVELSWFYGLAQPLLFAGMPIHPVGLELLPEVGVPSPTHTLLLTYDGMTPPTEAAHKALASWVKAGGILLCFGQGDGPYETLPGWWNSQHSGASPWLDLFSRLGLNPTPRPGLHTIGRGVVCLEPESPIALARRVGGAVKVREHLRAAMLEHSQTGQPYHEQGYMTLRRGPYLLAAVFAEGVGKGAGEPLRLDGVYIDLLNGDLPVRHSVTVAPGQQALLLDTTLIPRDRPSVLAASARVRDEVVGTRSWICSAFGPAQTTCVLRLRLPSAPISATVGARAWEATWDVPSASAELRFPNAPDGQLVEVRWD